MAQVSLNQSFVQSITVVKPTTFTDKRLKGFQLTVSKAGTKVYYFKFSQAGRQFKVKLGKHPTMSFKEAKGLYLEKLQEIELGVNQQHRKQTLQYFMDNHYKLHLKSKNRSAHDSIKTLETHFLSWLGNRTIESITVTELATWRDKRLQSGISPNTVKRNLTEFKSMFNYLVNELGYLKENPIANLKSPKEVEPEEKLYLSSEEYQKILATIERYKFAGGVYMGIDMGANQEIKLRDIEPYDYVLEKVNLNIRPHVFPYYLAYALEIALFTGLRKSELLGLWWSHIDFDNRLITVAATNAKSARKRDVPISPKLSDNLRLLHILSRSADKDKRIFPVSDPKKAMKKFQDETGLSTRIGWHHYRHNFASSLVLKGVALPVVMSLMGHTKLETTQKYLSVKTNDLSEAVAVLDEIIIS